MVYVCFDRADEDDELWEREAFVLNNMSKHETDSSPQESQPSHHQAMQTAHSVRKWVVVLAVFVVASWIVIGAAIMQQRTSSMANGLGYAATKPMSGQEGPWGELDYAPIVISAPREYVSEEAADYSGPVVWHFSNVGPAELATILKGIGFDASLTSDLLSMSQANVSTPGMSLYPSKKFVLGLSPEDRAKLYLALADYRQNFDIRNQFLFRGDSPAEWFAGSDVTAETRKLVEPLIYRKGSFMYFADMRSIMADIPSRDQKLELLRTLRREVTFLLHVNISEKSNLESLVNYWGRGGRVQDVRPILESLVRQGPQQQINVTHLLPALARRRLYTYPARSVADMKTRRDCHWTSLNFFNETPDDKFADMATCLSELRDSFYRIHGNLQLGDIAVVIDSNEVVVHSATYIADDVFFHRCGSDSSAPWTLARGDDLIDYYPRRGKLMVSYYRRKDM